MTRDASSSSSPAVGGAPADPRPGLVADWLTIWQSEMAAMAVDRESAEHVETVLAAWLAASAAMRRHEPAAARPSRADAPARSAPTAAAPDAGAALDGLRRRLAELERRLGPEFADDVGQPAAG